MSEDQVTDFVDLTAGVVGKVKITWRPDGTAWVVTEEPLTYRNRDWNVHGGLFRRTEDGGWHYDDDAQRRKALGSPIEEKLPTFQVWPKPVPKTFFKAITGACTLALAAAWSPERTRAAQVAEADANVRRAERALGELYEQVATAEAAYREAVQRRQALD